MATEAAGCVYGLAAVVKDRGLGSISVCLGGIAEDSAGLGVAAESAGCGYGGAVAVDDGGLGSIDGCLGGVSAAVAESR